MGLENKQTKDNTDCSFHKEMVVDWEENIEHVQNTTECKSSESEERLSIRKSMLEHLSSNDKVYFRSLKEGEVNLNKEEKFEIARDLLDCNYGIFLAKFGNHLLKQHLSYFENRPEDDALVVDLHLKQLHRALEQQSQNKLLNKNEPVTDVEMAPELTPSEKSRIDLRISLLDHLSLSQEAHFRSQQVGEPDLETQEKRDIAESMLDRNPSLFLSRFGTHLLVEHLLYFDQTSGEDSYEVQYHLKTLRKNHCKIVSEVGIKNRRFEALKKLVADGKYFCETEMRNRNPLLYEQLVGKFLTVEERKERLNNIDTTNITFVNLLLEQADREAVKKLKKEQEEAENVDMEKEEDVSDEEMEQNYDDDIDSEDDTHLDQALWGEEYSDGEALKKPTAKKVQRKPIEKNNEEDIPELSDAEKRLFMEEFRSSMFSSFLQGKDADFDYSQVDYNPDYDDLEVQGQDEEEKYFDEESSQDAASCGKMSSDGEDLLEQFMDRLQPEPTPQQLADRIHNLGHNDT